MQREDRCNNNELPTEYLAHWGLISIYKAACYGSALRNFIFSFGLPRIFSYYKLKKPRDTFFLGAWLEAKKLYLVDDHLCTAVVDDESPFDFLCSRQQIVTQK